MSYNIFLTYYLPGDRKTDAQQSFTWWDMQKTVCCLWGRTPLNSIHIWGMGGIDEKIAEVSKSEYYSKGVDSLIQPLAHSEFIKCFLDVQMCSWHFERYKTSRLIHASENSYTLRSAQWYSVKAMRKEVSCPNAGKRNWYFAGRVRTTCNLPGPMCFNTFTLLHFTIACREGVNNSFHR